MNFSSLSLAVFAAVLAAASAANPPSSPAACGKPLDVIPQKPEQGDKFCVIAWDDNKCEEKEDVCISKCKLGFKECTASSCKGYPAPRSELVGADGSLPSASNVAYFSNTTGVTIEGALVKVVPGDDDGATLVAMCPSIGRPYAIEHKVRFMKSGGTFFNMYFDKYKAPVPPKYFADQYAKVLGHALKTWDAVCREQPNHARKIHNPRKVLDDWCAIVSGTPDRNEDDKCSVK